MIKSKCLLIGLLCIAFLLGVVEGYYLKDTLTDHEIRVEANKIISEMNNKSFIERGINLSNVSIYTGLNISTYPFG